MQTPNWDGSHLCLPGYKRTRLGMGDQLYSQNNIWPLRTTYIYLMQERRLPGMAEIEAHFVCPSSSTGSNARVLLIKYEPMVFAVVGFSFL